MTSAIGTVTASSNAVSTASSNATGMTSSTATGMTNSSAMSMSSLGLGEKFYEAENKEEVAASPGCTLEVAFDVPDTVETGCDLAYEES